MRWKPRLRTVFLLINLVILLLPLGGIVAWRLYENELIRRTETEMIAQGVLIGSAYRQELLGKGRRQSEAEALPAPVNAEDAVQLADETGALVTYHPIPARLDIAVDPLYPPASPATLPETVPDRRATLAGERLLPLLLAAKDVTLTGIRVVDAHGTVIATTGDELGRSLLQREEVSRALKGEQVSLLRRRLSSDPIPSFESLSRGKRVRVFVALPITVDGQIMGVVVLSRTPLDMGKALFQIRWQLLTAASVLILVVLLIALFTSLTISRPVQALIRQAERVVRGEKGAAIPLQRPVLEEIDQLSQALSGMAHSLEERADYIRTFATNVSHEFKTPLTSIRGTVELLQEHLLEMTTAERSRFLQIIASDTERLDRLVRRLLDLARADVLTPGDERASVGEILNRLSHSFAEKGVAVTVEQAFPALAVRMAPETFESIVANLIDNARQHGGDKVRVQLACREIVTAKGAMLELEVTDNGPGISPGNRERIFRPFFTTARDKGGSGLGLAIVQALVDAHSGTIELTPSETGARFVIRLPAGSA